MRGRWENIGVIVDNYGENAHYGDLFMQLCFVP